VNLGDPRGIVQALDEAQKEVLDGERTPRSACRLLSEFSTAVADTGPLELGVSAGTWLRARENTEHLAAFGKQGSVELSDREVRDGFDELRRLFRRAFWLERFDPTRRAASRRAVQALFWGVCALLVAVTLALRDTPALDAMVFVDVAFFLGFRFIRKEAMDAVAERAVAAELAPAERALWGGRMKRSGIVVTTDQRVLAADWPARSRSPKQRWSVWLAEITSFSTKADSAAADVLLRCREGEQEVAFKRIWEGNTIDYQSAQGAALALILQRRTGLTDEAELDRPKSTVR
jgi:hypothetical protein